MTLAIREESNGDVVVRQSTPADVAHVDTFARLAQWAQAAKAAHQMAVGLVETSFVPAQFRGKPHEATAAILSGAEVGLSPMAALRSFDIIQGTAAARAITLRAIVQSKGHRMWEHETTETRAVVKGCRKGEDKVRTSTWTLDRARGLGLLAKDNWKKQPGAMLLARATAECARLVAADAILGIAYSSEEVADGVYGDDVDEPTTVAPEPTKRRAQRKPVERATSAEPPVSPSGPEPDFARADAPAAEPEQPTDGDRPAAMVTRKQQNEMFALWGDLGYGGDENRAQRLDITAKILGLSEPIGSSSDLTEDEADRVIAALRERKARQGGEPS